MAAINQLSTGPESAPAAPSRSLIVSQPEKLEGLLETINLMATVSERMGEDRSGDLGSSGGSSGQQGDDSTQVSARDKAIAAIPAVPVMQKQLQEHIAQNIKSLRQEINQQTVKGSKAGSAYKLNELYKRIRRLQCFLSDILSASTEIVQRIYIRVFIDKQPLNSD